MCIVHICATYIHAIYIHIYMYVCMYIVYILYVYVHAVQFFSRVFVQKYFHRACPIGLFMEEKVYWWGGGSIE